METIMPYGNMQEKKDLKTNKQDYIVSISDIEFSVKIGCLLNKSGC
jgi:hypothetical protein